jgi:rubrerythrin
MSSAHGDPVRATLLRAIQIEARNAGIYDSLAHLFLGYDDSLNAIFREMAAEERQHGAVLDGRYRERFGPVPSPTEDPKEVIEAPDLEDSEALIFDSMTVEQALVLGLHAEESAREFYLRESALTPDPELQAVYKELCEFEQGHVDLLKAKLAEKRRAASSTSR